MLKPPKSAEELAAKTKAVKPAELEAEKQPKFWKFSGGEADVKIHSLKFPEVLKKLGYFRLDLDDTYTFVKINQGRVKEVTETHIADGFFDFLDTYPMQLEPELRRDKLKEKMYDSPGRYFNELKLARLRPSETIQFNTDTRDEKYFYTQNGWITIDKNGIHFSDYKDLKGHIWESEVLPRNYNPKADGSKSVYAQFLYKISNQEERRYQAMLRIIGYILHSYFTTDLKALVFTDAGMGAGANGRTGKTLWTRAAGYMLSPDPGNPVNKTFVDLNGKDFDAAVKHKYQLAGRETKVIVLNDLKPKFPVEVLYNDVTEGPLVERKGDLPFRIKAKMILTTNTTIKIEGESSKARFYEFEFADYFNSKRTPLMEFGHWFFRDWDKEEWARFDNLMYSAVHEYFKHGCKLPEVAPINLLTRKINETTSTEFVEFIEQQFRDELVKFAPHYDRNLDDFFKVDKRRLYADFITAYPDYQKLSMKKFTQWIVTYTTYKEGFKPFDPKTDEYRSNNDHFMFFRKETEKED